MPKRPSSVYSAFRILVVAIACCAYGLSAEAQVAPQDHEWARATAISGFAGIGVDGSHSGPAFGGTVGWELTPRFALDGSGAWTDYGSGSDAFAGAIKLRANLTRSSRAAAFLQGGIGLYRASFDASAVGIPGFYRRRMGIDRSAERTFTDPSFVFGGGINVSINRTLKLRPDVEMAVVTRNSRAHLVSSVRLHLVYVIEDHPVTPSRKRN
jgi:hypothetical protein